VAEELLPYYERELAFVRQLGAEFARKYPRIASRLLLEGDRSEDPLVERLIQAFAFVAGRIHHKLDDDFPELTESLLSVLYPHHLAPVPSMSIVEFVLDPARGKFERAHVLRAGSVVYTKPVGGAPCRFRTCYPVELWPMRVKSVQLTGADRLSPPAQAPAVLRLGLECAGDAKFSELAPGRLRFYLHGEGPLVHALYERLFNNVVGLRTVPVAPARGAGVDLPPDSLRPVGFGLDEGMLPYTRRSFLGYRLIQEYFAFPEKFLFVDLHGLEGRAVAGVGRELEVLIFLDHMPELGQPLRPDNFRLHCAPIVNLFEQIAEPIRVTHAQTEYRIVPEVGRADALEVHTVESVVGTSPDQPEPVHYRPFFSFKHAVARDEQRTFWYAARRPSPRRGDNGTEVFLSLVDLDFSPAVPATETLTLHVTCTNRDLPAKLPFGGDRGDFELEGAAPIAHIRCLTKPTATLRPSLGRGAQWRLLSHLSLNYLSVAEGGRDALHEILRLYDTGDSPVTRQQIAGIMDVRSRRVVRRPSGMAWNGFCRGLEIELRLDEEQYVGGGVFLLGSVLERFFGLYATINSFTETVVTTKQRTEPLKRWPPRAGDRILL
jgi:type VI secretion system protein ImpG